MAPFKFLAERIDRAFWKWNDGAVTREAAERASLLLAAVEANRSQLEDAFGRKDVDIVRTESGSVVAKIPELTVDFWTEVSGTVFSDLTFANWPLWEVDFVGTSQAAEYVGLLPRDEPTDRRGFALRSIAEQVANEIELIARIWAVALSEPRFVANLSEYCQEQQRIYNDEAAGHSV